MKTKNQAQLALTKSENSLIGLLGFGVFTSKPLIYLALALLIANTCARLAIDETYRQALIPNRLFWASLGLFSLGVASAALASTHPEDAVWMSKKTMVLLLAAPLLLAFQHATARAVALAGLMLGFWSAFLLTGNMHGWTWSGQRLDGATWLVDTWGVLCAMTIVLLTPVIFAQHLPRRWRLGVAVTVLGAGLMLLTTGARGPWLGVVAGAGLFLVIKQRKALLGLCIAAGIGFFAAQIVWPAQTKAFETRLLSITNTQTDASNSIRLALWETGAALIAKQFRTGDIGFWLGNGQTGKAEIANKFYYEEYKDQASQHSSVLEKMGWQVNDMHNMYLESMIQNGALWTFFTLAFLLWMAAPRPSRTQGNRKEFYSAPTLICFMAIGITYSLLPHFSFIFLIFFIALSQGLELTAEQRRPNPC